jgi:hypothetical protein
MTRTDIINLFINKYNYKNYLEIGVSDGSNFKLIDVELKESVDPAEDNTEYSVATPTYRMTSDEFFESYADKKYDIIFIDGLHHSDQVDRDIKNSVNALNADGVIILHDCNPFEELHQRVPRQSDIWNGDVWKSFVKFKENNLDWDCYTINTDWGCGVLKKRKAIELPQNMNYWWMAMNRKRILNLISVEDFVDKKL